MEKSSLYRALPSVDEVLSDALLVAAVDDGVARSVLLDAVRATLETARAGIADGTVTDCYDVGAAVRDVLPRLEQLLKPSPVPVVNATGIIIHTNLGRSVLPAVAQRAVSEINEGYSNLEYNVEAGVRGSRHDHVEALLCELVGCEAAMVVNNNAAAVMLTLAALGGGAATVVSRGQLVEIGGSFRIPDIMAAGGTRMIEVGTTNKTHLRDYVRAIDEAAEAVGAAVRLLYRAHTSNYRVSGFVEEVSAAELVALARERNLWVAEDLGSGVLVDLAAFGLPHEPTVAEVVAAGVDVVSFSGDKLLGGPQAGIVCGRRDAIARLKAHPIARAVRCDKMTLAALQATLSLYRDPARAVREVPTLAALVADAETCRVRAEALALQLERVLREAAADGGADACAAERAADAGVSATIAVVPDAGYAGGGSLPETELAGYAVAITVEGTGANRLEQLMRCAGAVPVVGHIAEDRLLLNVRTLSDADCAVVCAVFADVVGRLQADAMDAGADGCGADAGNSGTDA
ncbi:MAG: L-seryl-tRNA(Sec) selenium transferase [Actinomycetes bacterium]|nr:L-seryl-tRNA(Sec) selenium transferase [Actinomycetes bacterium]